MKALPILVLLIVPILLHAQDNRSMVWYFGDSAGLDFRTIPPTPLADSRMSVHEGSAAICDSRGSLLFYTDGASVWNRAHGEMPNGTDLGSVTSSSTQAALIVPSPGDSNIYYIFVAGEAEGGRNVTSGVTYSIVDMRLDGGMGDVVRKQIPLLRPATEKLTAVHRCDRTWVITHKLMSDEFHLFSVTDTGVSATPIVATIGPVVSDAVGCLQSSPDGTKIAIAVFGDQLKPSYVGYADFDPNTGRLDNYRALQGNEGEYGVCFSPDNTKLYVTAHWSGNLYQYDLNGADRRTLILDGSSTGEVGTMQLGPDDRIYVARVLRKSLGVIEQPNAPGRDCLFKLDGISLGDRSSGLGLPTMFSYNWTYAGVSAGPDLLYCSNTAGVRLYASGARDYRWSPSEGLSCDSCPSPLATPTKTTTYIVTGTAPIGCSGKLVDSVVVEVAPAPIAHAWSDTVTCGAPVRIGIDVDGGRPPYRYSWSPAAGLDDSTSSHPLALPADTTTYRVSVLTADGCVLVDSVRVAAAPALVADAGEDPTICSGERVTIGRGGSGGSGRHRYRWSPATGLDAVDIATPTAYPASTTTYTLELVDETLGCIARDSVTVTVRDAPRIAPAERVVLCFDGAGEIGADAIGGTPPYRYRWSPSIGLDSASVSRPIASPASTTTYSVIVDDANGCSDTASVVVVRESASLELDRRGTTSIEIDSTELLSFTRGAITLRNLDDMPLTVATATFDRNLEFSIPPSQLPLVIPPLGERTLEVYFSPSRAERIADTLRLQSDCGYSIAVAGAGRSPLLQSVDECGTPIEIRAAAGLRVVVSPPYPNPATNDARVAIERFFPPTTTPPAEQVGLYDTHGALVAAGSYRMLGSGVQGTTIREHAIVTIDSERLAAGSYMLVVTFEGGTATFPLKVVR